MSGDLISRKYVVAELLKEREQYPPMVAERYSFGVKLPHSFNMAMRGGIRKGLRIAETAPAVDAVEVVRCKDCRAFGKSPWGYMRKGWCIIHDRHCDPDYYCASGVRKDAEVER